jgi:hypothetical protein
MSSGCRVRCVTHCYHCGIHAPWMKCSINPTCSLRYSMPSSRHSTSDPTSQSRFRKSRSRASLPSNCSIGCGRICWNVLDRARLKLNSSVLSDTVGHGIHVRITRAHWTKVISCYGDSSSSTVATDGRSNAMVVSARGTSITERRGGRFIGLEASVSKLVCGSWCCSCCWPCSVQTLEPTSSLICWRNTPKSTLSVFRRMRRKITCASASGSDWMRASSSRASSRSVSSARFFRCRAAHLVSPSPVLYSHSFPDA